MAFNIQRFVRQTTAYNSGQILSTKNPSATPILTNGPAWFTYASDTDAVATISAANYFADVVYDLAVNDRIDINGSDASAVYKVSAVDRELRTITLALYLSAGGGGGGGVVLPTITDHIIVALDNSGSIGNILSNQNKTAKFNGVIQSGLAEAGNPGFFAAYSASGAEGGRFIFEPGSNVEGSDVIIRNATHEESATYLVPDTGAAEANFIMSKSVSTQHIETGSLTVDDGSVTSVGGAIVSRVAASGAGSLQLNHVSTGGDFFVQIQNRAMGQNTTYIIPDIQLSQGAFAVSTTPFLQKIGDAFVSGGGTSSVVTDDFCTTGCVVYGSWRQQTNQTATFTIFPDNGSFTIETDVDPGAANFRYTICKPQAF